MLKEVFFMCGRNYFFLFSVAAFYASKKTL
jgi:hypothetical protein